MKLLHDGKAALISFTDKIDESFLQAHPGLVCIGSPTTGTDHIDFAECEKRGVKVITLGTAGNRDKETEEFMETITSTAEYTIYLILSLARQKVPGVKLRGKTIGIIGYGRIGKMVERMAGGLGMTTLTADIKTDSSNHYALVIERSDFITVHIPLKRNEGFFPESAFKAMKRTAYFVNTSRPGVVAKGVLFNALEKGLIAGAASDFAADETPHPKLLATPHVAGNTIEDRALTEQFIINRIAHEFRDKKRP